MSNFQLETYFRQLVSQISQDYYRNLSNEIKQVESRLEEQMKQKSSLTNHNNKDIMSCLNCHKVEVAINNINLKLENLISAPKTKWLEKQLSEVHQTISNIGQEMDKKIQESSINTISTVKESWRDQMSASRLADKCKNKQNLSSLLKRMQKLQQQIDSMRQNYRKIDEGNECKINPQNISQINQLIKSKEQSKQDLLQVVQSVNNFWDMNTAFAKKFMIFDNLVAKTDRHMITSLLPVPMQKVYQYRFKVIQYGNNYNSIRFGVIPGSKKNIKDESEGQGYSECIRYLSNPQRQVGSIVINEETKLFGSQYGQYNEMYLQKGDVLNIHINLLQNFIAFQKQMPQPLDESINRFEWFADIPENLKNRQLFIFVSLTNQSIIELKSITEQT